MRDHKTLLIPEEIALIAQSQCNFLLSVLQLYSGFHIHLTLQRKSFSRDLSEMEQHFDKNVRLSE